MRPEKELLKQEIKDKMDRHNGSFVIMQYAGLTANGANEFRREIAKMGGDVEVVRKRILEKAIEGSGIGKLDESYTNGHIALVFLGSDPIETTKAVYKFSKDLKMIQVLGGRFEGQLYPAEDVKRLSELPSKDQMRAQLLSVFEAPMAQTLAVVEAVLSSVVYCLDNKVKQDSNESNENNGSEE